MLEGWSNPEALKGSLRSHGGLSSPRWTAAGGVAVGEEEISAEAHSSAGAHRAGGRPYSMPFQTLTSPDDATSRPSAASTIGPPVATAERCTGPPQNFYLRVHGKYLKGIRKLE